MNNEPFNIIMATIAAFAAVVMLCAAAYDMGQTDMRKHDANVATLMGHPDVAAAIRKAD